MAKHHLTSVASPEQSNRPRLPKIRRRLAPNVVCMFAEDREPIVQRRKGRLPRGVSKLRLFRRIRVGVLAEIISVKSPENASNIGARVVVTRDDPPAEHRFEVRSLDGPLCWTDRKTGERGRDHIVWVSEDQLRRLWTGRSKKH